MGHTALLTHNLVVLSNTFCHLISTYYTHEKGSPYSITERMVTVQIPILDNDVNHRYCVPSVFPLKPRSPGKVTYGKQTHTHPFNGPFPGLPRCSGTSKVKPIWQWHQLGHMQVCSSLQTDNHASTPPLKLFYRPDAPPAAQPHTTASKRWRQCQHTTIYHNDITSVNSRYAMLRVFRSVIT